MDQRQIGAEPALQHIGAAIELLGLLALCYLRPDAGRRIEARNAGATCTDALCQRALRVEFDLQFARQILLREGRVLAHIGADHFPDLARVQQDTQPRIIDPGVVGNDGEALHAARVDCLDQRAGNAAQAEAARHDHHAVAQQTGQRLLRVRIDLVDRHRVRPSSARTVPPGRRARQGATAWSARHGSPLPAWGWRAWSGTGDDVACSKYRNVWQLGAKLVPDAPRVHVLCDSRSVASAPVNQSR